MPRARRINLRSYFYDTNLWLGASSSDVSTHKVEISASNDALKTPVRITCRGRVFEKATFIILYDDVDSRGSPVSTTSNGVRNEQDVWRDVQAMERFERGSPKEKERFSRGKAGRRPRGNCRGRGEERKRSGKVLSLAADSATSDEAAPRCFE